MCQTYYCRICKDSFQEEHNEEDCIDQLQKELDETRKLYNDMVKEKERIPQS